MGSLRGGTLTAVRRQPWHPLRQAEGWARFMSQPRARDTIEAMRAMVPPGQSQLGEEARRRLTEATRSLLASHTDPGVEHERFLEIRRRQLCLPADELAAWLRGARVLVTGGTGCIGGMLTGLLAGLGPAQLVSLSRGQTRAWPRQPGVDYRHADIRDRRALDRLLARPAPGRGLPPGRPARPRPGRNRGAPDGHAPTCSAPATCWPRPSRPACRRWCALRRARRCGPTPRTCTPRPSARRSGWPASAAATHGLRVAAARFTHVVDNSLIYLRLLLWARQGVIRLHGPGHLVLCAVGPGVSAAAARGRPGQPGRAVQGARDQRPRLADLPAGPGPGRAGPGRFGHADLLQRLWQRL